ncbi:pyridoxal phosphate-dependent aminotransferase [Porphyromonas levii]|uniref:pyridoxal phosphate-dependent aminotransferase n=1 Tax=Porphyromonas levii TaxID=28114 RepID=UPI00036ADB6A|nr:aminotransferase class I/II-fold pyridoxal phosphate-dependent enzyme [Porphyromonas levii]
MRYNDHGDDRYLYRGVRFVADFSSNVPHLPHDEALWEHLTHNRQLIHHYPEPQAFQLEARLSAMLGVPEESLLVTSGATEAIYLMAHLFQGATSSIMQPTFSEYRHAATVFGHTLLQEGLGAVHWLCNPNNPTGRTYPHDDLLRVIQDHPDTVFVVDQSYHAFTPKAVLQPEEITTLPNCLVIQSLTKSYAIPGLRLGYILAHPQLIRRLVALKMPWSVNALAIEAGHYLLASGVPFLLAELLEERKRLVDQLEQLDIMDIEPTDTHYFLAKLRRHQSQELKDWLAIKHGILIRNASNFPTLTPQHIRIATQSPEKNALLVEALSDLPQNLC